VYSLSFRVFMTTFRLAPIAALFLLAFSSAAYSNDATLPEVRVSTRAPGTDLNLDEPQTTVSRLPMSPRQTPGSVSVIDRGAIDARGATNTQEILSGAPGVTFSAPPGSAGSVVYRGFGAAQLTQLFNGITVQYDAIAARPVDSWIYDRVEVIGGPSTFLFGAGAVGGSINYVTKLPVPGLNFTEGLISVGSWNTVNLAAGVNRHFQADPQAVAHTFRLDANRSRSDTFVENSQRNALNLAGSWTARINDRWSHTLALEYQNEKVDRPYWGTPLLNPTTGQGRIDPATRFTNYNSADGVYEQTVQWLRSITETKPSAATTMRNTLYMYDALRDYRNVEVYRFNTANTQVIRSSPLLQRHDQQLFGNRFEVTHRGQLAGRPSDWAGGLDLSVNTQTRFPRSLTLNVSTVNPTGFAVENFFSIPGMIPGFVPDRTNKVTTAALFIENRTKVTDTLALVSALRHEAIDLEVTNKRTVTATDPAFFKNTYTPTTGRLGLVKDLSPTANVYLQYATAADPPAGILTTANFNQVRNFDLTTGSQVEVGSKFDVLDGRGSVTLAAYQITRKNLSTPDVNNPGTSVPVGQQSSQGIEIAAALRATRELLLQGNLSIGNARFDDFSENVGGVAVSRVGNRPANVPQTVANLWATYQINPQWAVGSDLRYVGQRYGNAANTISDGGYTLLGAFARWNLNKTTSLTLRGRNLTDKVYAASITGTPMFFLGAPRSFDLTLQARF
jgi:iron complex outermembrane receptor protein